MIFPIQDNKRLIVIFNTILALITYNISRRNKDFSTKSLSSSKQETGNKNNANTKKIQNAIVSKQILKTEKIRKSIVVFFLIKF